jgi:lysozyme
MKTWKDYAIPLVAHFEGCEKRRKDGLIYPYLDKLAKPHVWTRGYGRTYGISESSPAITKQEAMEELGVGLETYAMQCLKLAPRLAEKPQFLAAVASWAWNCGVGAFRVSRLRKAINEGRWNDAVQFIKTPRTAGGVELLGLVRRRDAESKLFQSGIDEN